MSTFPRMAEVLAPREQGLARIEHYEVTKFDAMMASVRGIYTEPGKVAMLKVAGKVVMSDTDNERRSNREVVRRAKGDVLIAGLGLGMILHPILAKPEVNTVTVVEKHQDVIDLIAPTLPQAKLTMICADIFTWNPPKGQKWDCIYFDIWADICEDNLPEMAKLHQRFKGRKKPGAFMDSWYRDELKSRARR